MELTDLTQLETLALVGLLEFVVMEDGLLTDDEERQVQDVVRSLGALHYEELIDEFDSQYADESDFRSLLESVSRQDSRELIYGTILGAADANTLMGYPAPDLLRWLVSEWNIKISLENED
jgi:hypothetical protein